MKKSKVDNSNLHLWNYWDIYINSPKDILCHGEGKNIWIRFGRRGNNEAELVIENDGQPFTKPGTKQKGLGMHIMRSRAAVLNASLKIEARPKGGAVVSCILPLKS